MCHSCCAGLVPEARFNLSALIILLSLNLVNNSVSSQIPYNEERKNISDINIIWQVLLHGLLVYYRHTAEFSGPDAGHSQHNCNTILSLVTPLDYFMMETSMNETKNQAV